MSAHIGGKDHLVVANRRDKNQRIRLFNLFSNLYRVILQYTLLCFLAGKASNTISLITFSFSFVIYPYDIFRSSFNASLPSDLILPGLFPIIKYLFLIAFLC